MRFVGQFIRRCVALLGVAILAGAAAGDVVTLDGGTRLEGTIVVSTPQQVKIRTEIGTLSLDRSQIAKVELSPSTAAIKQRLAPMAQCLAFLGKQDWGSNLEQIPATVIDKGVLRNVPYISHRCGSYEMNVYGGRRDDNVGIFVECKTCVATGTWQGSWCLLQERPYAPVGVPGIALADNFQLGTSLSPANVSLNAWSLR